MQNHKTDQYLTFNIGEIFYIRLAATSPSAKCLLIRPPRQSLLLEITI